MAHSAGLPAWAGKQGERMYAVFAQLMQQRGLTAYRVSRDTGITQATFSRWKNGVTTPSIDTLQTLADYFGVTLDQLTNSGGASKVAPAPSASIEQRAAQILSGLSGTSADTLMLDGKPASKEAIDAFRQAIEMGVAYARQANRRAAQTGEESASQLPPKKQKRPAK